MAEEKKEKRFDPKKMADKIQRRFDNGVSYKRSQGFYDRWNEYELFWEGEHWPQPEPGTETLPRPATNHFAAIIERKIAALLAEEPEIYFDPKDCDPNMSNADEAAELLTKVAKRQAENLGGNEEDATLADLNEEVLRSAALFGTGIYCFTWDNTVRGGVDGVSAYIGDVVGREIDPTMFFPGNPADPCVQTQPWIIVAERRPLEEVKNFYREYAKDEVDELQPDKENETMVYEHEKTEQSGVDAVNVLHCWWKEEDEEAPGGKRLYYAVACQGKLLRYEKGLYKHGLYPFVVFRWCPRKKNFWGKPESADIINNQKEINRIDAVMLLSAYTVGMPHIRYKDQFINVEDITNDPGALIRDGAPLGAWAVDYMTPPPMPAYPSAIRDKMAAELKDTTGMHDAWSGKAPSSRLNASAIIALQEAAGILIRSIKNRFHRALREIGILWLAFWKEFYTEARLIKVVGPDNQIGYEWFRGTDYADMRFDVRVKSGNASPYSRALYMANLDKMLQLSIITPEEYLESIPPDVFPKAQQILQKRRQAQAQAAALQAAGIPVAPPPQPVPGQVPRVRNRPAKKLQLPKPVLPGLGGAPVVPGR